MVLFLIFGSVVWLPAPALAASDDSGPQPVKYINGQPVLWTDPTMEVTATYDPYPAGEMDGYGSGGIATSSGGGRRFSDGPAFISNNHTASVVKVRNHCNCQATAADPVVVSDGSKVMSFPLFALPGEMGFRFTLYYHSMTGSGVDNYEPWLSSIDYLLDTDCGFTNPSIACNQVTLYRPDGSSVSFSGNHASFGNFQEIGGGGLATLVHNSSGTWTLHDEDSTVQTYNSAGQLTSIKDVSGVGWTISSTVTASTAALAGTISSVQPCVIPAGSVHAMCTGPNPPPPSNVTTVTTVVTHTDGQSYTIVSHTSYNTTWASQNVTLTDPAGNQYTYEETGSQAANGIWVFGLTSITLPGTPATTIAFTGGATQLTGIAYNGTAYWATGYNSSNEVSSDGAADGTERTSILYATSGGGMVATITNPLGLTTKNTYTTDSQGNYLLASVSNSAVQGCGATTNSMAWDANDNLTRTVDNNGFTHTYSYAASGQLQTETEASGTAAARTTSYTWDPNLQLNRLLGVTVPGESKTSYAYNAQNRIASVTRTNLTGIGTANQPLTTTYAYALYGNGMVATMTVTQPSPGGSDHTTYAYDAHGNLTSVTDGLGHATTYSSYNGLGEVGKIVGPNGDETDYAYDARGRIASKTTHPNGGTATWTYGYDGFGKLASVSAPDGEVTTWTRDVEMRVKTITHNDKDGTSTESFGYDANGDVISDVIARGSDVGKSTSYVYNALGKVYQVKGTHGQVLTYAYDGNGNLLSATDALGHTTRYAYDALNRVIGVTDAANGVTSYAYDAGDHVIGVEDPRGLVTSYAWDGLGLLWQQKSPDSGATSFVYDASGRLASKTPADGVQVTNAYDALNRLVTTTAGGLTRAYTWDACTNGKGRLCAAGNQGYDSVGYSYTPEGWITGRAFTFNGGASYSLGYAYDNMGHLSVVDYPDGNQALYDYTDGVVADVRLKVGSSNVYGVTNIGYRPMDLAMSSWTSYNGLSNTIGYDSDLRPADISVPGVESLAFTYDAANRITEIINGFNSGLTQSLGYDAVNQLTSVSSGAETGSFGYDADGNRTSQVVNGTAATFNYEVASNRLASVSNGTTYGYNADGDTTMIDGKVVYQYGPFDRLANAGGDAYRTSAEGQRIFKRGASGTTYFAPDASGTPLAEYPSQTGAWLDDVWLNGRLVTLMTSTGAVYSVHADQTGRPIVMTNQQSQAIIRQAQGLPFTRNVSTSTWFNMNLGFPGQYYDSESGLWHNGNRDYDASLGHYIESDPIGLAGGVNTYAYVGDNPVSRIDPLGLCNYCKYAHNAPSPQIYQQIGETMKAVSVFGGVGGVEVNLGVLLNFRHMGVLDPQHYGADPSYANYAFGVEMSANGMPLGGALMAAQFVAEHDGAEASYAQDFKANPDYYAPDSSYPDLPSGNVAAIEQGYSDQQNGTLCTIQ